MSVIIEWDDKGLKKIFDALTPDQQHQFHKNTMKIAARDVQKIVKREAESRGLNKTGVVEKNGWRWVRFGRVPRAVTAGKLWKKGTKQTVRVFNRAGRTVSFVKSAPHAHLVILGHSKFLPNRDGTSSLVGFARGVPIYQAAFKQSEVIFEKAIEKSVGRMVKRLNKQGKL